MVTIGIHYLTDSPVVSRTVQFTVIYVMVGWFERNGTTSVPKSVLRYVVDKVKIKGSVYLTTDHSNIGLNVQYSDVHFI